MMIVMTLVDGGCPELVMAMNKLFYRFTSNRLLCLFGLEEGAWLGKGFTTVVLSEMGWFIIPVQGS